MTTAPGSTGTALILDAYALLVSRRPRIGRQNFLMNTSGALLRMEALTHAP